MTLFPYYLFHHILTSKLSVHSHFPEIFIPTPIPIHIDTAYIWSPLHAIVYCVIDN